MPEHAGRTNEPPPRRGISRLIPQAGPSWWDLAVAAVAVAFAAHRFAITTFYGRFGVSPEEVGVGTTSAVEGTIFVLALVLVANGALAYLYGLMFGGDVLALWRRISSLWAMPERGRLSTTIFIIHRLIVILSIIALFVVFASIDTGRHVGVGRWEPELTTLVALAFAAFWFAMWALGQRFVPVAAISRPDETAVRRVAGRFAVGVLIVLTLVLLGAPAVLAHRDADAVENGKRVSQGLYQATPVTVTPIDGVDVLREMTSHCLLYLGRADGITVLYDADQNRTVRIPSSDVIVIDAQRSENARPMSCAR